MKKIRLWHSRNVGATNFLCGKKIPKKLPKQDPKLNACTGCFNVLSQNLKDLNRKYGKLAEAYNELIGPACKLHQAVQHQLDQTREGKMDWVWDEEKGGKLDLTVTIVNKGKKPVTHREVLTIPPKEKKK